MAVATQKNSGVDLTEGPIGKQIILFTIPLILGNIFQQLYNTADSIIVGRYVGMEALAAVGSSASLIQLLVSFFMGLALGAGVVISRYFGARDYEAMRATIHTSIAAGLLAGVFLSVAGVLFTPVLLRWMQTPETVMDSAVLYFRIFFGGIITTVMYNVGSGIFRALGDSKKPLYFLVISSIVNVLLDLLFVAVLGMGVAGAAFATVLSQGLSMILVYYMLFTGPETYRVHFRDIRIHMDYLRKIISIGLPGGVQNTLVSVSNVIVQRNINIFGDIAMAGCAAYLKLAGFALLPSGNFAMALSTFVSQNIGAKNYDRAQKGARFGLLATMVSCEAAGVVIILFAPQLIAMFNSDPEVIHYGVMMAHVIAPAYFLVAFTHGVGGVLRGAGLTKVPMYVMFFCWTVLRVIWLQITVPMTMDIRTVFWTYPLTWICSAVVLIIYYRKTDWVHKVQLQ